MSTHAALIIKTDGIYQGCYLHFDGYPAHVAPILSNDFNSAKAAEALVKIGMIESITLGGFIKSGTSWGKRAETTFGATIEEIAKKMGVLHIYVFDGSWTYDVIPITKDFRRSPKWKYKGHELEDVMHTPTTKE